MILRAQCHTCTGWFDLAQIQSVHSGIADRCPICDAQLDAAGLGPAASLVAHHLESMRAALRALADNPGPFTVDTSGVRAQALEAIDRLDEPPPLDATSRVGTAADGAWAEALARFGSAVNPENGLDDDQVDHFRHRLLGSLDELAEQIAAHQDRVEAVRSALVAVDAGVYGICLRCRRPIGYPALSREPVLRTCSACAGAAARTGPASCAEATR